MGRKYLFAGNLQVKVTYIQEKNIYLSLLINGVKECVWRIRTNIPHNAERLSGREENCCQIAEISAK